MVMFIAPKVFFICFIMISYKIKVKLLLNYYWIKNFKYIYVYIGPTQTINTYFEILKYDFAKNTRRLIVNKQLNEITRISSIIK